MFYHTISLIGKRDSNEDHHDVILNLNHKNPILAKINYFGVYDGHGGKYVSTFLKNNLSSYMCFIDDSVYQDSTAFGKEVKKIYNHVQDILVNNHKDKSYDVGSTANVVIQYHNKKQKSDFLYVLNVGDSRSVICDKNGKARALSTDHKPKNTKEKERIYGIKGGSNMLKHDGYELRVGNLAVSRAFGDLDCVPYVTHTPEITKYKMKKDQFIIVSCDGLWDVMTNQHAVNFVKKELNKLKKDDYKNMEQKNKKNIAYKLAEYAIEKGSTDNVSIIIAFFD